MSEQVMAVIRRTYNLPYWGGGYFNINDQGEVTVCPTPEQPNSKIALIGLADYLHQQGQELPALLCFPQILQHRLRAINRAFQQARTDSGYRGEYCLVYPIKVNQHRRVIEALIDSGEPLGLEAGSKAELIMVLAYAGMTSTVIVCNGYKDSEYIRLALMGEKLGHQVYLVIEKMSELTLILQEAAKLGVQPRLGVRARLSSHGTGKWQTSGGERSKFGLSAAQILQLIDKLAATENLSRLQLLHFHLGSQLADIRDITLGVQEAARFYIELHKLGVTIQCFDVGGGLGIDYEGTRSRSDCSVNYSLNEYANSVITGIATACDSCGLPHPTIFSESGRAVTAHHTVLVTNIIGVEQPLQSKPTPPDSNVPQVLKLLWAIWQELQQEESQHSLSEWFDTSQHYLTEVHAQYIHGLLDLQQRAWAEQLYYTICRQIQLQLDPDNRAHRSLIDELQEKMADRLYVNFSLFRSIPDAWGIDQLFPVLPLTGLQHPPERRAMLLDITCDSDGTVDHFIDGDGVAATLPIPPYDPASPPLLGFFLVGAYQEILGNMHNLFGDTAAVNIWLSADGEVTAELSDQGNTVAEMLEYVRLFPTELLEKFQQQLTESALPATLCEQFIQQFRTALDGYTYLEEEE